jgi:hypothetical protein
LLSGLHNNNNKNNNNNNISSSVKELHLVYVDSEGAEGGDILSDLLQNHSTMTALACGYTPLAAVRTASFPSSGIAKQRIRAMRLLNYIWVYFAEMVIVVVPRRQ